MQLPDNLEFWSRVLTIVVIDLVLSGDNALVMAMAVRRLDRRQRNLSLAGGTVGAIVFRLLSLNVVIFLLSVPLCRLAGGLLLVWIAWRLVRQEESNNGRSVRHAVTLFEAVWAIILADLLMGTDNVLSVAAVAKGDQILVTVGILFSLPIIVWGSGALVPLVSQYAAIVWLGGGVLGYVAGEIALADPAVFRELGSATEGALHYPLPIAVGMTITVLAWRTHKALRIRKESPRTIVVGPAGY